MAKRTVLDGVALGLLVAVFIASCSHGGAPASSGAGDDMRAPDDGDDMRSPGAGDDLQTSDADQSSSPDGGSCPYAAAGYDDGCSGALPGAPQHPTLLAGYSSRPPWDVAGVDYAVGLPSSTTLTSWESLASTPGLSVSGNMIRCQTGDIVLSDIDFSLAGGGYIYIPTGGCSSLKITNSFWACPSGAWPSYWLIQNEDPTTSVSIAHSTFDGTNCGGNLAAWVTAYDLTFEYNYATKAPVQIVQGTAPGGVTYKYNMIDDNATVLPMHANDQEWDGFGTISVDDVEFNTTFQQLPECNEAFQFYNNTAGTSIMSPVLAHNTMIALPATPSNNCGTANPNIIMSNLVHGTDVGGNNPTQIIGTALNQENYFDIRGAYAAYYAGSMSGWTSSGNIDMNSGMTITPN